MVGNRRGSPFITCWGKLPRYISGSFLIRILSILLPSPLRLVKNVCTMHLLKWIPLPITELNDANRDEEIQLNWFFLLILLIFLFCCQESGVVWKMNMNGHLSVTIFSTYNLVHLYFIEQFKHFKHFKFDKNCYFTHKFQTIFLENMLQMCEWHLKRII